mmetsp:Transcript_26952/g.60418  ORF Transcript_26952/g.60418 Transcript_26952/m.60418 type:complete len:206 (-) Transcript_26952:136-753(-)
MQVAIPRSNCASPFNPRTGRILSSQPLQQIQVSIQRSSSAAPFSPRTRRILSPQPPQYRQVTTICSITASLRIPSDFNVCPLSCDEEACQEVPEGGHLHVLVVVSCLEVLQECQVASTRRLLANVLPDRHSQLLQRPGKHRSGRQIVLYVEFSACPLLHHLLAALGDEAELCVTAGAQEAAHAVPDIQYQIQLHVLVMAVTDECV